MIKMTNTSALVGSTINIKKAPIAVPMKAPNTGIKAVNPTNTAIVGAYGICNINIPIKQSRPIISASIHCPETKFPNVTLSCEGEEEQEALDALVAAVESGLGEQQS